MVTEPITDDKESRASADACRKTDVDRPPRQGTMRPRRSRVSSHGSHDNGVAGEADCTDPSWRVR